MQLGPETRVPEVQSYFDKRAPRRPRLGRAGAVRAGRFSAYVLALVHANICDHSIWSAVIVRCATEGVPHRGHATKIRDSVRI